MSDSQVPVTLLEVRPPNPYDFSSLCEFLESIFLIPDFSKEYEKSISIIEQIENLEQKKDP